MQEDDHNMPRRWVEQTLCFIGQSDNLQINDIVVFGPDTNPQNKTINFVVSLFRINGKVEIFADIDNLPYPTPWYVYRDIKNALRDFNYLGDNEQTNRMVLNENMAWTQRNNMPYAVLVCSDADDTHERMMELFIIKGKPVSQVIEQFYDWARDGFSKLQ